VPANSQRSKKRQKVDHALAAKVEYAAAAAVEAGKEVASDVRKVPVGLDSLPWNEVEMPDMFEDAEGFFGLEEVDDVEVIKEGNSYRFVRLNVPPINLLFQDPC
jgi:ATP-dependent RNA helicase DDX24/MAK5